MSKFLNLKSDRVLVTGGAGYIGAHACKALARAGYGPVVYDNLSTGHALSVKWGPFERGDLIDRERLKEVIIQHRPKSILHFAASCYVGESMENPALYYSNNVMGSLALLDVARDLGIKNLIFSSSCATYGIPDVVPIAETAPQHPINPYGRSKLIVEQMMGDYQRAYGLRPMILRYFNAAGADPGGDLGEDHDPETHLIPLAINAAMGKHKRLQIFGDDYPTPDGSCIRDYMHVSDIAEAHVLALKALQDDQEPDCFNLGLGYGSSVFDIVASVERVTGRPVEKEIVSRRAGDPAELVADGSKFRKRFQFNPQFHGIDRIVQTAWAWRNRKVPSALIINRDKKIVS